MDELRKLVEKWSRTYEEGQPIGSKGAFTYDIEKRCADELSALLDQHAVAEPIWKCKANPTADPPQDCDWPGCGCDPYANKVFEAIEESGFKIVRAAHAAEQPKLTERAALTFETWWGWFKGGYGETGAREEDIARCAWVQSKAVQRSLLTSPVAPPQKKENTMLHLNGKATNHIWLMEDGDEPHVIGVRLDCGDSGTFYMTRGQALDLSKQLSDFAAPPVAPGEQPPRDTPEQQSIIDAIVKGNVESLMDLQPPAPPAQERASDEGFDDWFQASEWYRPGVGLQLIRCAQAAWATAAKRGNSRTEPG